MADDDTFRPDPALIPLMPPDMRADLGFDPCGNPAVVLRGLAESVIPESMRGPDWGARWDGAEAFCDEPVGPIGTRTEDEMRDLAAQEEAAVRLRVESELHGRTPQKGKPWTGRYEQD